MIPSSFIFYGFLGEMLSSIVCVRMLRCWTRGKWFETNLPFFYRLLGHTKSHPITHLANVVVHDLDLLFQGQWFESRPFGYIRLDYRTNGDRENKYHYGQHIGSRLLAFYWDIWLWPILKVKVKVRQIATEYFTNGNRWSKRNYWKHMGSAYLLSVDIFTYDIRQF